MVKRVSRQFKKMFLRNIIYGIIVYLEKNEKNSVNKKKRNVQNKYEFFVLTNARHNLIYKIDDNNLFSICKSFDMKKSK